MSGPLRVLFGVLFTVAVALFVFALLWRSPSMALPAALGAFATFPRGTLRPFRAVCWALAFLLVPLVLKPCLAEQRARREALFEAFTSGGPAALDLEDRLAIAALGLAMGVLAAPVFPEVAQEQLLLHLPGEDRVRESDFATRSERVSAPLNTFIKRLPKPVPGAEPVRFGPERVVFVYGQDDPRVALALNPCLLSAVATPEQGGWRIDAEVAVKVEYPPSYTLHLFSYDGEAFAVEEGLFYALQELGWYHPYTMTWRWTERVSR
ncbi:MAG: hypothetical protein IPN01_37270 [Deltaproteobacteria bacterium]|nr:hypothetical protein [Deltaproteobacteria bacterium]